MRRITQIILTSIVFPVLTLAAPLPSDINPRTNYDIGSILQLVQRILQWILTGVSIVAVLMLIYAGFLFMTGAGNEDKIGQAKQYLKYSLIGIVVVFLSFSAVSFINSIL